MEKNVLKYFAPQMEVLELYTEGVLCQSGGGQIENPGLEDLS